MSHLETATFTNDDGTAINVPTSGVTEPGAIDPRKALEILLSRGWTPIPFANEQAATEAAKKTSQGWDHAPPQSNFLQGILESLKAFAQPRPDITSQIQRPYTYAGRVVSALDNETPQSIMQRSPIGELEAGGQAASAIPKGLAVAGMAKAFKPAGIGSSQIAESLERGGKIFKPAIRSLAEIAPKNKIPNTPLERMFPAIIDEKTGEVLHAMAPTGPGGHSVLYSHMPAGFNPTRGFVDPETFYAYSEAELEQILMKRHFGER